MVNYADISGLHDEDAQLAAARRRSSSSSGKRRTNNLSSMSDGDHAKRRFSVGARVYDSELGVTCHWCRQKTVETHVVCTAEGCGKGRLPLSFCGMCLRNRHGEDIDDAVASGTWQCPKCRGSCGDGCVTCCNCGPCRKAHGLSPTHQVINQARASGFDNVHDYLVFGTTNQTPEQLLRRKKSFAWGRWLCGDFAVAEQAKAAAEAAAAETANTVTAISRTYVASRKKVVEVMTQDSDDDFAVVPATPSPSGKKGVGKRPWAVALASRGETSSGNTSRPASPATPGTSGDPRSERAASRKLFQSPLKKQRQGDIRAMLTPTAARRRIRSA